MNEAVLVWEWMLYLLDLPFVEAVVTIALVFSARRLSRHLHLRPFRHVWDVILGNDKVISIVMADVPLAEFSISRVGAKSPLPTNVPLVGVQEAMAVSLLREKLREVYKERPVRLVVSADFGSLSDSNFVSVGGPSVNGVAYSMLERHKIDDQLRIVYPDHYAVDKADGEKYEAEMVDNALCRDYGFIVVGPNPLDEQRVVCLFFGIWPPGTSAAIAALVDPDTKSELGRKLVTTIREKRRAVAVVETRVQGLTPGTSRAIKVRDVVQPAARRSTRV